MRRAPVFLALILISATFAFPAEADGQCKDLAEAALRGDSDRTSALIASGVNVNCSFIGSYDTDDYVHALTPLNNAAWKGNLTAARLLLNHGADVNAKDGEGKTPLDNAFMGAFFREYYLQQAGSIDSDKISPLLKQACGVNTE